MLDDNWSCYAVNQSINQNLVVQMVYVGGRDVECDDIGTGICVGVENRLAQGPHAVVVRIQHAERCQQTAIFKPLKKQPSTSRSLE